MSMPDFPKVSIEGSGRSLRVLINGEDWGPGLKSFTLRAAADEPLPVLRLEMLVGELEVDTEAALEIAAHLLAYTREHEDADTTDQQDQ